MREKTLIEWNCNSRKWIVVKPFFRNWDEYNLKYSALQQHLISYNVIHVSIKCIYKGEKHTWGQNDCNIDRINKWYLYIHVHFKISNIYFQKHEFWYILSFYYIYYLWHVVKQHKCKDILQSIFVVNVFVQELFTIILCLHCYAAW